MFLRFGSFFRHVLVVGLALGLLSAVPYLLRMQSPQYHGLPIIRDKDYGNYYSRLERALEGHFDQADNGITPIGSNVHGMQEAGMETIIAVLFGWLGLRAPVLSIIITMLLTPLSFLLFYGVLRAVDIPKRFALVTACVYYGVLFHVVTRVMHPGWSFVPTLLTLIVILLFFRVPSFATAIVAGLLLGNLPYLYFWSFSFVWAVAGWLALLSVLQAGREKARLLSRLGVLVLVTILVALPFFVHSVSVFSHPLYPEIAIRASFLYQRTPESWPRSILLALQCGLVLSLWKRQAHHGSYRAILALVLGLFIAMHQNVIHNRVLMFSSHFEPFLVLTTLVAAVWAWVHRVPRLKRYAIALIALLFLLGAAKDYLPGYRFFVPQPVDFRDQHLVGAIDLLQHETGAVLTDQETGRLITSFTSAGILYTTHARFLLIADAAIAERYCVSEMFTPTPRTNRVFALEYNRILQSVAMQDHERRLVEVACRRVRADRSRYLRKYDVHFVLWNRRDRPDWQIDPSLPLGVVKDAPTWTLLRVNR